MIQTRAREEWLYDISWSWSDAPAARRRAGSGKKPQSLTLTMIHNPTCIRLIRSASLLKMKRDKDNRLSSQIWLDLFQELQRNILSHQNRMVQSVNENNRAIISH
jgi:hypothetical protein